MKIGVHETMVGRGGFVGRFLGRIHFVYRSSIQPSAATLEPLDFLNPVHSLSPPRQWPLCSLGVPPDPSPPSHLISPPYPPVLSVASTSAHYHLPNPPFYKPFTSAQ